MTTSANLVTALADLLPRTAIRTQRCPVNLQLYALRQTWRSWAEKTEAWHQTLTLDLVANQLVYPLTYSNAEVEFRRVVAVWVRNAAEVAQNLPGRELEPEQYNALLPSAANAGAPSDNGTPQVVFCMAPATTAVTGGLLVKVALIPWQNSQIDPPAAVLTYASDALVAGALAELAGMSGKPWTNARMGEDEGGKFARLCAQAKTDALRKGGSQTLSYRPSSFF